MTTTWPPNIITAPDSSSITSSNLSVGGSTIAAYQNYSITGINITAATPSHIDIRAMVPPQEEKSVDEQVKFLVQERRELLEKLDRMRALVEDLEYGVEQVSRMARDGMLHLSQEDAARRQRKLEKILKHVEEMSAESDQIVNSLWSYKYGGVTTYLNMGG